jgi:hypothetical protein
MDDLPAESPDSHTPSEGPFQTPKYSNGAR